MYTLEQLQQKNLKELKEIGFELNILPDGDRRCRQNWIDALVGVQPPLLQLLETSPAAEVELVAEAIEVQRQEPIETPPGVEPVEDAIEIQAQEPLLESSPSALVCPFCNAAHALYSTKDYLDRPEIRCLHCDYSRFKNYPGAIQLEVQEPPIESKFGRIVYRIVYPKPAVKPIAQNAETRPQLDRTESADVHNWRSHPAESVRDNDGAKTEALGSEEGDRVLAVAGNSEAIRGGVLPHQPIELAATYNDEQPPNRGDGKGRIEPKVIQSAIVPAAKNHLDIEKVDPNPILTGVTFSERFLARYSPPQPESIRFHADSEGQLNLLDFEVPVVNEPPDPDDFESLDAFREAIALWDAEHPEPLEVSLDSMCEWAPCPDEWYEPEPSEVLEHSPTAESSSTCNFSIPTFDAWGDRADEPPDTGNFARLPGPKPPSFPPMNVVEGDRANSIKKFARSATLLSGRAPPGGDAM
ncbi:hypothetical protein QUB10_32875 [Microcoleus sp. B5-D4]|uniref:hypothetical protein n=1 Tax=unclassified Microcoleus TaxID=2642155 RepID=UPI002FD6CE6A